MKVIADLPSKVFSTWKQHSVFILVFKTQQTPRGTVASTQGDILPRFQGYLESIDMNTSAIDPLIVMQSGWRVSVE